MRQHPHLQRIIRPLVEYRILLSLGLSIACGIILNSMFPIDATNRLLRLIALERPPVFHAVVWSYDLFLYSTPFLACSMIFSLLYVHLYRSEQELAAGSLPPYPDPHTRTELFLVLGEVHRQLVPKPSSAPQWLSIPERGLYTGIASFGSIGSGKTYGLILPAMRQLFAYRADDPARRLSGNVIAGFIPDSDRILILEDVAELYIRKQHVVSAEAQFDTHKSQIGFADLLKAALRHRPDRIIVGEIRGPEARVFLDALNTGHRGSLSTIHANSAADALRRLAQLAMRGSGGVPLQDVTEECRRSIDLIAQVANQDGWRHVTEIRTSNDFARGV